MSGIQILLTARVKLPKFILQFTGYKQSDTIEQLNNKNSFSKVAI